MTPTVTPTIDTNAQLVQRVIQAEAELRTGQLEATVEYGQRAHSSSQITFDLGDATQPSRLRFVSSYSSGEGQRMTELVIIDHRFWERVDERAWVEVEAREGVWGQVRGYLPGIAALPDAKIVRVEGDRLIWFDPALDIDVTLQVDPETSIPQQLRRASRSTDTVVIVTYSGWNVPVDIRMPSGP